MVSMYAAKRMVKQQKEEIKDEIHDYLSSQEGQASIFNLGQIFGAGIGKGIGLKGKLRGGKIFGMPIEVVMPFIEKFIGKKTEGAISKESQESSSDPFAE